MSWLTIESDFHWKLALFWMRDCERCCIMPILQMRNPRQGDFIICARVYKECSNYRRTALISHTSKVMLKILQARLQQYVNRELRDVQADLEKTEESEIKLPTSFGPLKKWECQKNIHFTLLTTPKPLTMWITTNCGKFWKRWEYQTTWPAS